MHNKTLNPGMVICLSLSTLFHNTPNKDGIASLKHGDIIRSSDGEGSFFDLFEDSELCIMDGENAEILCTSDDSILFSCTDTGKKFWLGKDEACIAAFV